MRTSEVICVGFSTKHRDNIVELLPTFEHNKGTNVAAKKVEQVQKKTNDFMNGCIDRPWMGELKEVRMYSAEMGMVRVGQKPGRPIAGVVADRFESHYSGYFQADGSFNGPPIRFLGFDIKQFVKLLGAECAEHGAYLPHEMWYGSDHRDMGNAVLPATECKNVPLRAALTALKVKTVPTQYEPGDSVLGDLQLSAELAHKFNLFPEFDDHLVAAMSWKPGTKAKNRKKKTA